MAKTITSRARDRPCFRAKWSGKKRTSQTRWQFSKQEKSGRLIEKNRETNFILIRIRTWQAAKRRITQRGTWIGTGAATVWRSFRSSTSNSAHQRLTENLNPGDGLGANSVACNTAPLSCSALKIVGRPSRKTLFANVKYGVCRAVTVRHTTAISRYMTSCINPDTC